MSDKKIYISLVIPAYNERERIVPTLEGALDYLAGLGRSFEVIVVDDGSTDGTAEAVAELAKERDGLRSMIISKNRGKGHAVKKGLLSASGEIAVFMDADGAVTPDEISRNLHYLQSGGYDIFVGSRALRGPGQRLEITAKRKFMGFVYNLLVRALSLSDFKDTQCGFKMFKRHTVGPVFSKVDLDGYAFDVEALYIARSMGYRIKEGPVSWRHAEGSKVDLLRDPARMVSELFKIKRMHGRLGKRVARPGATSKSSGKEQGNSI